MIKNKVLIVDDNLFCQRLISIALVSIGFDISTADDGVAALRYLESETVPDIIILDIHMPNMNGIELLEAIKENDRFASIPIIISSNDSDASILLSKYVTLDIASKDISKIVDLTQRLTSRSSIS